MAPLTLEQLQRFAEEGCLAIPGELKPEQVSELVDEIRKLLKEFPIETHPMTRFSTSKEDEQVGDEYFLGSSDKISFFFEQDAFDENGKLTVPKDKAINKIGHYLHELNDKFKGISTTERNRGIAMSLGGMNDPRILQSMVICKQPNIGGEVITHQDATFLYTKPQSAIGFWYALEDCTKDNGALEYVPGSHKWAKVHKRFVRVKQDDSGVSSKLTAFETTGEQAWSEPDPRDFRLLECKAGTLILIHNSVLHRSNRNESSKSRLAYTFHVIDGACEYDDKNWLQIPPAGGTNFTRL